MKRIRNWIASLLMWCKVYFTPFHKTQEAEALTTVVDCDGSSPPQYSIEYNPERFGRKQPYTVITSGEFKGVCFLYKLELDTEVEKTRTIIELLTNTVPITDRLLETCADIIGVQIEQLSEEEIVASMQVV